MCALLAKERKIDDGGEEGDGDEGEWRKSEVRRLTSARDSIATRLDAHLRVSYLRAHLASSERAHIKKVKGKQLEDNRVFKWKANLCLCFLAGLKVMEKVERWISGKVTGN